ncbi:MAG: FecR domain-containing protein [Kiritimatiellae bacterium]|nr:FecR domain-containing protein [Kiritimatiellia bacterium]
MNGEARDQLLLEYLETPAGTERTAEVDRLLREDPAAGRRLAELGLQECLLDEFGEVERGLDGGFGRGAARLARFVRRIALPAAAAAAVLVGVFYYTFRARPSQDACPRVVRCSGDVLRSRRDVSGSVVSEDVLGAGTTVRTGPASAVALRYPDGTTVDLDAQSVVQVHVEGGAKQLLLARGILDAEIRSQPDGLPMLFQTPRARITVLGTRLTLAEGPGGTLVDLREGTVRVTSMQAAEELALVSGHYVIVAPDGGMTKTVTPENADHDALLERVLRAR